MCWACLKIGWESVCVLDLNGMKVYILTHRQTDAQADKVAIGDRPPSVYTYMPPLFLEPTPPGTPPGPRPPGRVPCSVSSGGVITTRQLMPHHPAVHSAIKPLVRIPNVPSPKCVTAGRSLSKTVQPANQSTGRMAGYSDAAPRSMLRSFICATTPAGSLWVFSARHARA